MSETMYAPDLSAMPSTYQRVLDAACTLFLREGYRVSMESVARLAGVAKQTVYAHFESKDALFRAAARALLEPLHEALAPQPSDLPGFLFEVARQYMRYVNTSEAAALCRMLSAQVPRFPRLAADMYRHGLGQVQSRLAERLSQAMTSGDLRRDDPNVAAELFLSMIAGLEPQRTWCGVDTRGQKAQDSWTRHAVNMFIQLYAPTPLSSDHHLRTSS
ncbi:TetR/AcrR family transcriptional regulator [Oleiagrimonas sp. C23AA]|uniref:TetR/AcrR family transcriptional regulator n=1 Tax=Oleiagrimonas sp. C23AA TaxID=2719047 RepID=UPI001420D931|nr:TetR/AcrR family transcriptional regulator [Oleiagrimonas sp. C23AA]NII10245.1 TetR/AcrR family transcriptional regulator [Oleiagrimonas sp. C23AA]